jgi:hypothetical protein
MKKLAVATFALLVAASMAMAGALNQFKAGDISFSVLDKDGATPVQSASIKALDAASGDVVAEVVADDLGQAVLALDAGRYLLNISDINLAVFDVDAAEGLSLCRVIMPDAALLAGGQEAEDDDDGEGGASFGAAWVWPVVGGIAAVGVLVGAGFVIDNNTDHHHGHRNGGGEITPPPPTVYPPRKHKDNPSKT